MADTESAATSPAADRGRTVIADKVVERVASIATSEVEAVIDTRKGWTKLIRKGLPHAEAVVAGDTSKITVEVAATWPTPLAQVAAQVREHVTRQVVDITGVTVTRVDVTVADVVHLDAAEARVQ
ncbi:Asp23/Gls24 family envelope stress response protein [Nocardioides hwasunensis]|uniref:Asp23/Gls24 family envelope stress response protein n=1 Tax=Nocardioides hwasunensis TaxID=397258 RepID=A0ABR8MEA5_9ACTN|nr:Asp23/Gls24 family envelope stress response protein [Nocardioides hwasunensis]MBD3912990.1 Asp23/Gls24 family envelope stress response protein [Nocardioides hwasunensis]